MERQRARDGDGPRPAKIPRPANAFMLYANANRKTMAGAFPLDSNKVISKRLGRGWKELPGEQRAYYFAMAKKVDAAHKEKYPDYVYSPKEARIRKALRDANRERAMGAAPAARAARRPTQPWLLPDQDDPFTMAAHGFPIGATTSQRFVGPTRSHNKHVHLVSHDRPYHQTNPMAQLQQQQTEMWHHYHEGSAGRMRAPLAADQFVPQAHPIAAAYHQHAPADDSPPPPPPLRQPQRRQDGFGSVELYQEDVVVQNPFEKEDVALKKRSTLSPIGVVTKPQKSLPDFNAAFGSTERGRFQSPPVPRLQPKQGQLDFFLASGDLKFDDFNI